MAAAYEPDSGAASRAGAPETDAALARTLFEPLLPLAGPGP